MNELSALCLALTASSPSVDAVKAALAAGADPNQTCPVDHTYIGYDFAPGEGLFSILFPAYGLVKLAFGGSPVHATVDTLPLALGVGSRQPEVAVALVRAGARLEPEPLQLALQDALDWGRSDMVLALLAEGAAFEPAMDGELGLALLRLPGLWPTLVASGVSPDLRQGETPLEAAVQAGDRPAVMAFLAMGASPDGNLGDSRASPLADAVGQGDLALAKALVAAGARVEPAGGEALTRACRRSDAESAAWLLDLGVDANRATGFDTPLVVASSAGSEGVVRLLLDHGAKVDQLGSFERTALNAAAAEGQIQVARLLIEAGADVGHTGFFGYTPLGDAVSAGQRELVAMLVGAGAPLTWSDGSALEKAGALGDPEMVRLLHSLGAELAHNDDRGRSPLDLAVISGGERAARELIEQGAQLGTGDSHPHTALHAAAEAGSEDGVEVALALGVPVDAPDAYGDTPLIVAVRSCRLEVARLLISRGARTDAVGSGGQGLAHAAARCGEQGMVELVVSSGVSLASVDARGRSAMHVAVVENSWGLKVLIAAGAPLDLADAEGATPLHRAMELESEIFAEYVAGQLVGAGARADLLDHEGRTALDLAVARRDLDLVQLALRAPHAAPAAPYPFGDDTFQWNFDGSDLIMGALLSAGLPVALEGGVETAASTGKGWLTMALVEAGAPVTPEALGWTLVSGDLFTAAALADLLPPLDRVQLRALRRQLRRSSAPSTARHWLDQRYP